MPEKIECREFYEFIMNNPDAARRYGHAQQAKAEGLVDEIIDISDTEIDSQRARNRIDARRWYASKMQPQKYGDRLDVNLNQTIDIGAALADASKRILLPPRFPDKVIDVQSTDITHESQSSTSGCESDAPEQDEPDIFS